MRRSIWRGLFVLAALAAPSIGAKTERPNVVIILTDDQGTLDARSFGSNDLDTPEARPTLQLLPGRIPAQ